MNTTTLTRPFIFCFLFLQLMLLFSCKKSGDTSPPPFIVDTLDLSDKKHWTSLAVHPAYVGFEANNVMKLVDSTSVLEAQSKMITMAASKYMSSDFTLKVDVKLISLCNSGNLDRLTPPVNDGFGETKDTNDDNINEAGFSTAIVFPNHHYRVIFAIVKAQDYNVSKELEVWKVINSEKKGYYIFQRIYSGKDIPMNKLFHLKFHISYVNGTEWDGELSINGKSILKNTFGMSNTYGGMGSWIFQCKGTTPHPVTYEVSKMTVENSEKH